MRLKIISRKKFPYEIKTPNYLIVGQKQMYEPGFLIIPKEHTINKKKKWKKLK